MFSVNYNYLSYLANQKFDLQEKQKKAIKVFENNMYNFIALPSIKQDAESVKPYFTKKISEYEEIISSEKKVTRDVLIDLMRRTIDSENDNKILALTSNAKISEEAILNKKLEQLYKVTQYILFLSLLGLLGSFIILCFIFWLMRYENKQRQKIEQSLYNSNTELAVSFEEMKKYSEEIKVLTLIGEYLQVSKNLQEAYKVFGNNILLLFPNTNGTLGIVNKNSGQIEVVATWGNTEDFSLDFGSDDCWAIRLGRVHNFIPNQNTPICSHLKSKEKTFLCNPMSIRGEVIGLISINKKDNSSFSTKEVQIIQTLSEHTALAFANLILQEKLLNGSVKDQLTGLYNRRYLDESLIREFSLARRNKKEIVIMMLDIDHFKKFNDTYGHEGGDALLTAFGLFLQKQIRTEDIACRYGGEEFALVMPTASIDVATKRANDIREGVKKLEISVRGKTLEKVTISIGVALYPINGNNPDEILKAADQALYKAKNEGRDRVIVAD